MVGSLTGVSLIVAVWLCGQAAAPAIQHRVWKGIRAQRIWNEYGRALPSQFQVRLSPGKRVQVRFTIAPANEVTAEGSRFRVFTVAQGLRITATGSASAIAGRQADFAGIWMLPSGDIGYSASSQTHHVAWIDAERPPEVRVYPPRATGRMRMMGKAREESFELDLAATGQARLSFTMPPDARTSVTAGAFTLESGRDGLLVTTDGAATLVTPAAPGGVLVDRIELWLTQGGGVAYRAAAGLDRRDQR